MLYYIISFFLCGVKMERKKTYQQKFIMYIYYYCMIFATATATTTTTVSLEMFFCRSFRVEVEYIL